MEKMSEKNREAIGRLRSQLNDSLLPQPDFWDNEKVLAAWSRYQGLRDEAEDYIDEAYRAEAAIGRATSAYEGQYRAFLDGKIDEEPEEPDYAALRDEVTSATARAGAAVSRAMSARGTYQRLLKSEENQRHRFETAQQELMPAREKAKEAWLKFRALWGHYKAARAVVWRQVHDRGLDERAGIRANDISVGMQNDLKDSFEAAELLERVVLSGDMRVTMSWATAPLEELEKQLPDWTRKFIAEWGTNYEKQLLRNAEYYERAHGVVKSSYLVPADMPPEEAEKKAPSQRPFGAEVD